MTRYKNMYCDDLIAYSGRVRARHRAIAWRPGFWARRTPAYCRGRPAPFPRRQDRSVGRPGLDAFRLPIYELRFCRRPARSAVLAGMVYACRPPYRESDACEVAQATARRAARSAGVMQDGRSRNRGAGIARLKCRPMRHCRAPPYGAPAPHAADTASRVQVCQQGAYSLGVLYAAVLYHGQQVRYGMPLYGYYLVLVGISLGGF